MLQKAINASDFTLAKELLSQGESLPDNLQDYNKRQIFDRIIRGKAFDLIDTFVENGFIETDVYEYDSFDKSFFQSLFVALENDDDSIAFLNNFIPKIDNLNDELQNKSLLSFALEKEVAAEIVQSLIDNGCDVNFINRADENLLHQVVKQYTRNVDKGLQYLNVLLNEGLDIEKENISGNTPLLLAVEFHRNEYIKWLMENGANPNTQNKKGESPFFLAVAQQGDLEKYKLMRQYGSPAFETPNNAGETMFFEFIRMISSTSESTIHLLKLLLEDGADPYVSSNYYHKQQTAVDIIAQKPEVVLKTILETGVLDVHQKDDSGNTILHKVCNYDSNHDDSKAKETYRKVKLLLANDADVNVTNDNEETPLMLASKDNLKTKTVELLLKSK